MREADYKYLLAEGYSGHASDMLLAFLRDKVPTLDGSVNDLYYSWLVEQGYSGALPDMINAALTEADYSLSTLPSNVSMLELLAGGALIEYLGSLVTAVDGTRSLDNTGSGADAEVSSGNIVYMDGTTHSADLLINNLSDDKYVTVYDPNLESGVGADIVINGVFDQTVSPTTTGYDNGDGTVVNWVAGTGHLLSVVAGELLIDRNGGGPAFNSLDLSTEIGIEYKLKCNKTASTSTQSTVHYIDGNAQVNHTGIGIIEVSFIATSTTSTFFIRNSSAPTQITNITDVSCTPIHKGAHKTIASLPTSTTYTQSETFNNFIASTKTPNLTYLDANPESAARIKLGAPLAGDEAGLGLVASEIEHLYLGNEGLAGGANIYDVADQTWATFSVIANYTTLCRTTLVNQSEGIQNALLEQDATGRAIDIATDGELLGGADGRYTTIPLDPPINHLITKDINRIDAVDDTSAVITFVDTTTLTLP